VCVYTYIYFSDLERLTLVP